MDPVAVPAEAARSTVHGLRGLSALPAPPSVPATSGELIADRVAAVGHIHAPRRLAHAPVVSAAAPRASAGRAASWAVIAVAKALTIGFGVDALLHADSKRFRGKAMRPRAAGYIAALFIVPIAWLARRGRDEYPTALDLAVTMPLLLDAAGNAFGIYDSAHVDDVVHTMNAAIVAGVAGALATPHVDEPWQAALIGGAVAVVGETAWETLEYSAFRLGQRGMNLSYADTMDDIYVTWLGAAAGMAVTLATARTRQRTMPVASSRSDA